MSVLQKATSEQKKRKKKKARRSRSQPADDRHPGTTKESQRRSTTSEFSSTSAQSTESLRDQFSLLETKSASLKRRSTTAVRKKKHRSSRRVLDDYMSCHSNRAPSPFDAEDGLTLTSAPITENTYSERRKRNRRSKQQEALERRRSNLEKQLRRLSFGKDESCPNGTNSSQNATEKEQDEDVTNGSGATVWEARCRALEEEMAVLRLTNTKLNLELGLTEEELKATRGDLKEVETECVDLKLDLEEVEHVRDRLEKSNSRLQQRLLSMGKENDVLVAQITKLSGLFPSSEDEEDDDDDELDLSDLEGNGGFTPGEEASRCEPTKKGIWGRFEDEMTVSNGSRRALSPRQFLCPEPSLNKADTQTRGSVAEMKAPPLSAFFRTFSQGHDEDADANDAASVRARLSPGPLSLIIGVGGNCLM